MFSLLKLFVDRYAQRSGQSLGLLVVRHHVGAHFVYPGCFFAQNLRHGFLGETMPPVFRENADRVGADEASPFHHLLPSDETSCLLGHPVPNEIDSVVSGNAETVGPVARIFVVDAIHDGLRFHAPGKIIGLFGSISRESDVVDDVGLLGLHIQGVVGCSLQLDGQVVEVACRRSAGFTCCWSQSGGRRQGVRDGAPGKLIWRLRLSWPYL